MEGSKIPIPSLCLFTRLNIDTPQQFAEAVRKISATYPEVKLIGEITPQSEAALMIKGLSVFLRYRVIAHELHLIAGMGATRELLDHILGRLQPTETHPMHALENQIDTSRQGLLIWLNFQNILSGFQPPISPRDREEMEKWGLMDTRAIALGWGMFQGRGTLKLVLDGPKTGHRRGIPELHGFKEKSFKNNRFAKIRIKTKQIGYF